jgi:hypothetical protein
MAAVGLYVYDLRTNILFFLLSKQKPEVPLKKTIVILF